MGEPLAPPCAPPFERFAVSPGLWEPPFLAGVQTSLAQGASRRAKPGSGRRFAPAPTGRRTSAQCFLLRFGHRPSSLGSAVATLGLRRAHSSSGLGHRPLTAAARVRIPYAPSLRKPRKQRGLSRL